MNDELTRDEVGRPFVPGDRVQLSDTKGKLHTVTLEPGKQFHTHKGAIAHDDLLGRPEGVVVTSTGGVAYLALRPLLSRLRAVDASRCRCRVPQGRSPDHRHG